MDNKDKNQPEGDNVVYLVRNRHLPGYKYFSRSENDKGFEWSDFGRAALYRGEDSRGRAFNAARLVRQDCGYSDIVVEKFKLTPVEDR